MNSVKNANSQSHEWLGEINHLLPLRSNGEARHGQVRFLKGTDRSHQWGGPGEMQGQGLVARGPLYWGDVTLVRLLSVGRDSRWP